MELLRKRKEALKVILQKIERYKNLLAKAIEDSKKRQAVIDQMEDRMAEDDYVFKPDKMEVPMRESNLLKMTMEQVKKYKDKERLLINAVGLRGAYRDKLSRTSDVTKGDQYEKAIDHFNDIIRTINESKKEKHAKKNPLTRDLKVVSGKITCECGSVVGKKGYPSHLHTIKHQEFLKSKT